MSWTENLLMVAGKAVASVRLTGERWVAFEHSPVGARILGWYNVAADARDAAERAARARFALSVTF